MRARQIRSQQPNRASTSVPTYAGLECIFLMMNFDIKIIWRVTKIIKKDHSFFFTLSSRAIYTWDFDVLSQKINFYSKYCFFEIIHKIQRYYFFVLERNMMVISKNEWLFFCSSNLGPYCLLLILLVRDSKLF